MAQQLSSMDIHYLLFELDCLLGARIDKIYQYTRDEFLFRFSAKDGKKDLYLKIPGVLAFTDEKRDAPLQPPNYCLTLRKYIEGGIIRKITQKEFERILIFEITSKEGEYELILELFRPGNIILVEKNTGEIIRPLLFKRFKDRAIISKQKYVFPPQRDNPQTMKKEEFIDFLKNSEKNISKTLAMDFGFGGMYANEIMFRAGLKKTASFVDLDEKDIIHLIKNIKNIFLLELKPRIIENKAYPTEILSVEAKATEFSSLSKAIIAADVEEAKQQKAVKKTDSKTQRIISSQEKRIEELQKEIDENQRKGEIIYENYTELKSILDKASKILKEGTMSELEEYLKSNNIFKKLNKKEKKILLEI